MASFEQIQEQRRQAKGLLLKTKYEVAHAQQVCKLSLDLFDQLQPLHNLGAQEMGWLECAAFLHDIGWIVSGKKHHKHSLRLIVNADLPAFTEREKRIVGNIARYHRRSLPTLSHSPFALLTPEDQQVVGKLAAILRIADALDDSHESRIPRIDCVYANGDYTFQVESDSPCLEELKAIERKKDLFERVFKREFRLFLNEKKEEGELLEIAK